MRSKWLLLCLCAFGAAWIVLSAVSNFGVRGFAYGWYDVDTFATTQPYVVRFDAPQPDGAATRAGTRCTNGERVFGECATRAYGRD